MKKLIAASALAATIFAAPLRAEDEDQQLYECVTQTQTVTTTTYWSDGRITTDSHSISIRTCRPI
ncbi:MAG TPA: hypothetical protein VF665_23315 [Longimicrobium sp.]|jgi:hypothetical protein|uniref:hypothetical protein n=1 Tax=Longimicrobium sp. TaxID=2029185 RepID=UPI002ED91B31